VRLLNNLNKCSRIKSPVITWGIFDGVHLGHRALIGALVARARKSKRPSLVITFDEHPKRVLSDSSEPLYITSIAHRLLLLEQLGVDYCLVLPFTREFSRMSAVGFINNIILEKLRPSGIVLTRDTVFGHNQDGGLNLLRKMAPVVPLWIVPPRFYKKHIISSTLIRRAIQKNRLADALAMLGRPVSILGTVVHGDRRGRTIGFPTANLDPHHEILPPNGVYAGRTGLTGKKDYRVLVNIGTRPTFHRAGRVTIEVYILNYREPSKNSLYGIDIEVQILKFLRSERKFGSSRALVKQISRDIKNALKGK